MPGDFDLGFPPHAPNLGRVANVVSEAGTTIDQLDGMALYEPVTTLMAATDDYSRLSRQALRASLKVISSAMDHATELAGRAVALPSETIQSVALAELPGMRIPRAPRPPTIGPPVPIIVPTPGPGPTTGDGAPCNPTPPLCGGPGSVFWCLNWIEGVSDHWEVICLPPDQIGWLADRLDAVIRGSWLTYDEALQCCCSQATNCPSTSGPSVNGYSRFGP
jgi:hypothetical protein